MHGEGCMPCQGRTAQHLCGVQRRAILQVRLMDDPVAFMAFTRDKKTKFCSCVAVFPDVQAGGRASLLCPAGPLSSVQQLTVTCTSCTALQCLSSCTPALCLPLDNQLWSSASRYGAPDYRLMQSTSGCCSEACSKLDWKRHRPCCLALRPDHP